MPANRALASLYFIVFVDVLGLTLILPLLPFYAERYGASPFGVGLLLATFPACQLVSSPILGRLSDRFGRRPLLLASQLGSFVGFVVLGAGGSLAAVFVSRVIDGFTAGNISLAHAAVADVTRPEERGRAFGVIAGAFGVGFIVGPTLSGYLSRQDLNYPAYAAAILSLVCMGATALLLPAGQRRAPAAAPSGSGLPHPLRGLMVEWLLFCFASSCFVTGLAVFAERRFRVGEVPFGPAEVGNLFGWLGGVTLLVQFGLLGPSMKRLGERRLLIAGLVASAAGFALLGASWTVPPLLAATALASLGIGVIRPSLNSLISRAAGPAEQGRVMGIGQSVNAFTQIFAPIAAGTLLGWRLPAAWSVVTVVVSLVGLGIALRASRVAVA